MNKKRFFLEEVVDYTFKKYLDFKNLNVIFPNRRAGLYFQKALSKKINKSVWSPSVYTMEDFIQKYSKIKISNDVTDSIQLNYILYKIIIKYNKSDYKENFEDFFSITLFLNESRNRPKLSFRPNMQLNLHQRYHGKRILFFL